MEDLLLPLFPLEIVVLPEEPLPLHIFEERYKQMINDCLRAKAENFGQQEFGVVLAKKEEMETVGCTTRIINVTRKYADGRMDIFTVGGRRFEVLVSNPNDTATPYLRAGVEYFDDERRSRHAGSGGRGIRHRALSEDHAKVAQVLGNAHPSAQTLPASFLPNCRRAAARPRLQADLIVGA